MKKHLFLFILLASFLILSVHARVDSAERLESSNQKDTSESLIVTGTSNLDFSEFKVTFIELGADRCIPCKAMQPVMLEIAKEYKGQIQVIFYDVWKNPKPAKKYGIKMIPTQIFIDKNGDEIFRHVGFYPKEEIIKALKAKNVI